MSLHEALQGWRLPLAFRNSQTPKRIEAVRRQLEIRFGRPDGVPLPKMDLNRLFASLESAVGQGTICNAAVSELKWAPWVLFTYPASEQGKLAADRKVVHDYLAWAGSRARPRQLVSLLYNFLLHYPISLSTFHLLRQGLDTMLAKHASPKGREVLERCRRNSLLDANGPDHFAAQLAKPGRSINEIMMDAGFDVMLQGGKFMEVSYRTLLGSVSIASRRPASGEQIRRVMVISAQPPGQEREGPRFGHGVALADALLLPFTRGQGRDELIEEIKTFLVQHLGDPRLRNMTWQSVDKGAKQVILSWLVKAALEDFFNILSSTADPIWSYRRTFWSAYLNRGHIHEAWVVLGRDAVSLARQHFRKGNAFGRLAGASANQSVLLMRIGGLTVAEWSHNGTCRIWDSGTSNSTPGMYLSEYHAENLRAEASFGQAHHGSQSGNWQRKVHDYIRSMTNLNLRTSEYYRG